MDRNTTCVDTCEGIVHRGFGSTEEDSSEEPSSLQNVCREEKPKGNVSSNADPFLGVPPLPALANGSAAFLSISSSSEDCGKMSIGLAFPILSKTRLAMLPLATFSRKYSSSLLLEDPRFFFDLFFLLALAVGIVKSR